MLRHLRPLIAASLSRRFTVGATILYQGETPQHACIIVKGVVRVFSISDQGDEQVVTYHVAGEFFPSAWIFGKAASTLFFYEAVTDAEIAYVPRQELIAFMLAEPPRLHALLDYFTTNYAASMIRVNALEQPKARDKLLYTMFYLCERYATGRQGRVKIPLLLTHQNLASLVGLTRETTAMEMNKLKKERVLTYKQQHYTVNIDKLLQLMNEDSFRTVSIAGDLAANQSAIASSETKT